MNDESLKKYLQKNRPRPANNPTEQQRIWQRIQSEPPSTIPIAAWKPWAIALSLIVVIATVTLQISDPQVQLESATAQNIDDSLSLPFIEDEEFEDAEEYILFADYVTGAARK